MKILPRHREPKPYVEHFRNFYFFSYNFGKYIFALFIHKYKLIKNQAFKLRTLTWPSINFSAANDELIQVCGAEIS